MYVPTRTKVNGEVAWSPRCLVPMGIDVDRIFPVPVGNKLTATACDIRTMLVQSTETCFSLVI